ncbi:hypothetical protein [Acutalibacter muris]|uniref:hypothetical protein n=1 Tax=Acutalibacter muris TaxID=1796620 RepID=UPI0026F3C7A9|nr:hypothetical protein [Acutalibacter muris]
MSFYESELQKMICGIPFIQSHTLAGKSILGKLDRDLRVKISFVTTGIAEHYDALKIHIINRTEGEVDTQLVKFRDILSHGRNIVIDEDRDGPTWGLNKPLQSDYAKINQFLHNYLSYFAPEQEPEETPEMTGQSM